MVATVKKHELQIIGDYVFDREIINEDEIKKIFLELFPEKNEKYFNGIGFDVESGEFR